MTDQTALFEQAKDFIPGGVHSPSEARIKIHSKIYHKGKGAYIEDINGKNYIDFCMSFGPLILGHQDEDITK